MRQKNIFTYISILIINLLLPLSANAQKTTVPTMVNEDSIPLFRGIAVSVDAVGPVQMMISDYGQYEAALKVNLKDKYFPVIEIGIGQANHEDEATSIKYKTSAPFARIGCDFNIAKNKHDIYRIFAGARYAFTSFKYDISGPDVEDPVWGTATPYGEKDVKGSYHWIEALVGVDAKIAGPLRLGWSVRYRSRLAKKSGEIGDPWYVPGFGKQGGSVLGATFNITFGL